MKTKFTQILCIILAVILPIAAFSGCAKKLLQPDEVFPLEKSQIPENMLLPFDDDGKIIWSEANLLNSSVEYLTEHNGSAAMFSKPFDANVTQTFIAVMNDMKKTLVVAEIHGLGESKTSIKNIDLGEKVYFLSSRDKNGLMSVYKTASCAYILIRLDGSSNGENHYSLYKISMSDFETTKVLFEELKDPTILDYKPVIYLYPEAPTDVRVELAYKGRFTVTYPPYNGGWNVTANPDGTLVNKVDGLEYSYLFWEGVPTAPVAWDMSTGYCVAGADTAAFLQKALRELGLTPREYNEFIVYWLPLMQDNPYNLITFQHEAYENVAPLKITPAPSSVLRVFMVFKPLEKPVDVKAPETPIPFERDGFTVVEWGGSMLP